MKKLKIYRPKKITERKINIGLIGCGRISDKHIEAIFKNQEDLLLKAICDTDEERLKEKKNTILKEQLKSNKTNQLNTYQSYADFLKDVEKENLQIDLIILTTPSGLHPLQTIEASKLGINVCTEKPMATRWEDGRRMVQSCEDNGVHLFVVKQNRFNNTIKLLKSQIEKGRFGRIYMVNVNVFWQRPQKYYDQDKWRGTWELDGGALMNQASHYVDLLIWLNGPLKNISAISSTIGRDIEVEDTIAMNMQWRNGSLGAMAVTMLTYPKNIEGSVTVLGATGSVRISGKALNKIEYWTFSNEDQDDKLVEEISYDTDNVYGFGHIEYYENMIGALRGKNDPICDGNEGLKSLEVIIGAYRSASQLKRINFPLDKD